MTAFLWVATAATMIGSVFVASARYWWRSAHVPFEIDSPTAFMSGAPVPHSGISNATYSKLGVSTPGRRSAVRSR
jgi:hypothetical protein